MDLIAIAHPIFGQWLIEEAKRLHLIYPDQAFIPGKKAIPRESGDLEEYQTGQRVLLRPVKISDEPLLKEFFFNSLSDESCIRDSSARKDFLTRCCRSLWQWITSRRCAGCSQGRARQRINLRPRQYDINSECSRRSSSGVRDGYRIEE